MATSDAPDQTGEPPIAQLREAAEKGSQAINENQLLKKELAFTRAGIDTTSDIGAMVMAGFDGDLNDTEALSNLAAQINGIPAPASAPEADPVVDTNPSPTPLEAMEAQAGGTAPAQNPPQDLLEEGWTEYQRRMKAGARKEDAAAEVINRMIDGAVKESQGQPGMTGFIYDRDAWKESQGSA
jgi:hypothetical protein